MGTTFADLLDDFIRVRDLKFRSDPERQDAEFHALMFIVQRMLEMLRDRLDR